MKKKLILTMLVLGAINTFAGLMENEYFKFKYPDKWKVSNEISLGNEMSDKDIVFFDSGETITEGAISKPFNIKVETETGAAIFTDTNEKVNQNFEISEGSNLLINVAENKGRKLEEVLEDGGGFENMGGKLIKKTKVKIKNIDGVKIIGEISTFNLKICTIVFIKNDLSYKISYSATKDKYSSSVEKIMESIEAK